MFLINNNLTPNKKIYMPCEEFFSIVSNILNVAANVGSLLSGVCACIALWWAYPWLKSEQAKKHSDIAEYALNHLESCFDNTKTWINVASCCAFVYNQRSAESIAEYHKASEEERKNLREMYRKDPYELSNFCKSFQRINEDFIVAKNRARRLNRQDINSSFEKMDLILKKLTPRLVRLHHPQMPNNEKNELETYLFEKAPEEIREVFETLRTELTKILNLEHISRCKNGAQK